MASSDARAPINGLPPEILQSIWRRLPFFDLLRCQRVCKMWLAYLPGDDSTLHRALFSPLTRQSNTETVSFPLWIEILQHLELSPTELPRIRYNIAPYNPEISSAVSTAHQLHPIVEYPEKFAHLIHPIFSRADSDFDFYTYDDLKTFAKDTKSEGQAWEHMLACVPKVQEITMDLEWRINYSSDTGDHTGSWCDYKVKNAAGVTVLDVVAVIREELKDTESVLRQYCSIMDELTGYSKQ